MMVSLTSLSEQFQLLGIDATNDVLRKSIDLCATYDITDPSGFVEQWMTYTVSHLSAANPSVEHLLGMEKEVLMPAKNKLEVNKETKKQHLSLHYDGFAAVGPSKSTMGLISTADEVDDFLDVYMCSTQRDSEETPSRVLITQKSNVVTFRPAGIGYSPITGTRHRTGNVDSGKIVYTFGKTQNMQAAWATSRQQKVNVKLIVTSSIEDQFTFKSKYMYDSLMDKSIILEGHLYDMERELCKKHFSNDEPELHNVNTISPNPIKIIGRIASDFGGKLDKASTIIVGLDTIKLQSSRLDFHNAKSYSIFPGQTVIASGINPHGDTFYVSEIFSERAATKPSPPELLEPISLVVASGPFTNHDDLAYEPLRELILYCTNNTPDILFLIGPFIDAEHKLISMSVITETFESFYEKMITTLVESLSETIICVVSSHRDIISHTVYPTPPNDIKKYFPNVQMLSDPCTVDVSGLKVGITSTDVYSHLLQEELSLNAGDNVKRVVTYMLNESSFYPLNPPTMDVCIDSELSNRFSRLHELPNILILPSKEKCFIRDINNCLVINPGSLCDITSRGTFARVTFNPPKDETNLRDYVISQVVRI